MFHNLSRLDQYVALLVIILAQPLALTAAAEPDLVLADFEGDTYGDWKATGTAFGPGPARGTLPGQMQVEGFQGKGLVNSFFDGDKSTGSLTSPEFQIERNYLSFLIGGGGHVDQTCLNLMINGRVVRTITGSNTTAGGSERLEPAAWDVSEFRGKTAQLVIVDTATGGWGHLNVDHIVATDTKPPTVLKLVQRELVAEHKYLHLPVKNGSHKRVVTIEVDSKIVRAFDIELADGEPDWWAYCDISAWKGQPLTITVDQLRDDSRALAQIQQSNERLGETHYAESLRPQFHFSSQRGWLNDPNGLVFYQDEWHLFYQHNPYGWGWGNMHWGHAVSRDLVHWQELGEVLYPDDLGTMFSGSAVIDWHNTAGFQQGTEPPIVLIYTAAGGAGVQSKGQGFTQGLAYSNDRGRTWTKYAGNPVLPQITGGNRDPKVFWHEPTKKWVMPLYVERGDKQTIEFFGSPDLKEWKFLSAIDGFFECPDFFELPVDGDDNRKLWVLTAANSEYRLGTFDGVNFQPTTPKLLGHRGRGFYAAQTYSDAPNDRRIQVGWLQAPSPGMSFNQCMSTPLELGLKSTVDGPRLIMNMVPELNSISERTFSWTTERTPLDRPNAGELIRLHVDIPAHATGIVDINVRGAAVKYDLAKQELTVLDHRIPAPLVEGWQHLGILVDRTTIEVFASDGLVYAPFPFIADAANTAVHVSRDADTPIVMGTLNLLKSAWQTAR